MWAVGLSTSRKDASSDVSRVEDIALQSEALGRSEAVAAARLALSLPGTIPSPHQPPHRGCVRLPPHRSKLCQVPLDHCVFGRPTGFPSTLMSVLSLKNAIRSLICAF